MSQHIIEEKNGGNGWTIWSQAFCSCGWCGMKLWGFNNPDWYEFKREQATHLSEGGAQ